MKTYFFETRGGERRVHDVSLSPPTSFGSEEHICFWIAVIKREREHLWFVWKNFNEWESEITHRFRKSIYPSGREVAELLDVDFLDHIGISHDQKWCMAFIDTKRDKETPK